jgi:uncharacterized protein
MTASAKGTALVTGASSGIGAIYADRLAKRGYDLILVARNRDRLVRLANPLETETGRLVVIIAADLTEKEDVVRIETLLRTDSRITLLVNNAGFGAAASLLEADIAKMEAMIRLNVSALTRLTYAAVPSFVARGGGTIINIASIVAICPEILNGVYGGTKAFVSAFTQSLQHELGRKGMRIQAVLPGPTATGFFDVARLPIEQFAKRDRDVVRGYGGRRARRSRSGRGRHDPRTARQAGVGSLRRSSPRHGRACHESGSDTPLQRRSNAANNRLTRSIQR